MRLVAASERQPGGEGGALAEEACEFSDAQASAGGGAGAIEVSCASSKLQPFIKRSRGVSACACAEGQRAFAVQSHEFVAVRFADCSELGDRCRVSAFELSA